MHVQVAKSHLLEDLRQRATRLEPHLSNPATDIAYRQVKQRIDVLEKNPGDTVQDVQRHLRSQARKATYKLGGKLLLSGAFLAGLVTLISREPNGVLGTLASFGCLAGSMGVGLWSVVEQVDREMALEADKALQEELDARSFSPATGSPVASPTVSLGGEATLGQLRSLLRATRTVLESEHKPEASPARELLKKDLKRLKGPDDKTLERKRLEIKQRDALLGRIGSASPWAFGIGMLIAGSGHPAIGFPIAALGLAILPVLIIHDQDKQLEILDRWQPQLELFREADKEAQKVREWSIEGTGSGIVEGDQAVQVGGVMVRLRPARGAVGARC
ncbi:MAG: hypothetical protein AMXMBFR33_23610 [Candidatus Xenobia bacterium]